MKFNLIELYPLGVLEEHLSLRSMFSCLYDLPMSVSFGK